MAWYEFWNWFGGFGDNTLSPDPRNKIYGNSSDNDLTGTDQADAIYGLGGHDRLRGNGGADLLNGGAGFDSVFYDDSTEGVTLDLATGVSHGGSAEGDTLVSIEYVYGSFHNDTILGNDLNTDLYGLSGDDILSGRGGVDGLEGGEGNDRLKGGGGADWLDGGADVDTADYSQSPATVFSSIRGYTITWGVTVDLSANQAYWGDAEGDTFSGIENIIGSAYDDHLTGTDGQNVLHGMDGADQLSGLGGDDTLDGGRGIDTVIGGFGNDTYYVDDAADAVTEYGGQGIDEVRTHVSWALTAGADVEMLRTTNDGGVAAIDLTGNANGNVVRGNDGNNVINGGDGNDFLISLDGQDSYLFNTPLNAATNIDVIFDFNDNEGYDTIWLDVDIFSSGLTAGNSVAGSQFVIGSAALDAGDRIIYNDVTGAVYYDSDGTGPTAAIQFARMAVGLPLTHFDFLVVA